MLVFSFFLGSLKAFASNVQSTPLPLRNNPQALRDLSICQTVSFPMVSIRCCHLAPASSSLVRGTAVLSPRSWLLSPEAWDIMRYGQVALPHLCEELQWGRGSLPWCPVSLPMT